MNLWSFSLWSLNLVPRPTSLNVVWFISCDFKLKVLQLSDRSANLALFAHFVGLSIIELFASSVNALYVLQCNFLIILTTF
jgi:hypothetical protein